MSGMTKPWDDLSSDPLQDMKALVEKLSETDMKPAEYYFPPQILRMIDYHES